MNAEPTSDDITNGPYALIVRYSAGTVSREEMVSKLSAWPYAPSGSDEGTFDDVHQGHSDGLLSSKDVEEIQTRRQIRVNALPEPGKN